LSPANDLSIQHLTAQGIVRQDVVDLLLLLLVTDAGLLRVICAARHVPKLQIGSEIHSWCPY
jgi:hypothetical protein